MIKIKLESLTYSNSSNGFRYYEICCSHESPIGNTEFISYNNHTIEDIATLFDMDEDEVKKLIVKRK